MPTRHKAHTIPISISVNESAGLGPLNTPVTGTMRVVDMTNPYSDAADACCGSGTYITEPAPDPDEL